MNVATQYRALLCAGARDWWRTRGAALLGLAVILIYGLASFLAGLAVTEVQAQQVVFHAGLVRPVLALLFALVIVVNLVREFDDRSLDTLLARPLARRTWYLAKLSTQLLAAAVVAVLAAVPLLPLVPLVALAAWTVSFACELAIVAALALACAVSLGRVALALAAVGGFYALARMSAAFVLMSTGPTAGPASLLERLLAGGMRVLALLLPDLSRYTQSAWLFDATQTLPVYVLGQTLLYVGLLALLGLVDLERREL